MRRSIFVFLAAFVLVAAAAGVDRLCARAGLGTHCGCAAGKGGCEEPCSTFCGPNGYADCFKNGPAAVCSHP